MSLPGDSNAVNGADSKRSKSCFDTRASVAQNAHVEQADLERIARRALKELGVTVSTLTVAPAGSKPGVWQIDFGGEQPLQITCGQGSTPQWVRQQIFDQFLSR